MISILNTKNHFIKFNVWLLNGFINLEKERDITIQKLIKL